MTMLLSETVRTQIDEWIKRYPKDQKQSAVMAALHIVQEANAGSLTDELITAVAEYLAMPRIAVYEVATFYTMYHLKPVGRHVIEVCTNISCMLSNADEIMKHFKKRLNIETNETTPDGKFTLKEVECLAACANAPACLIGKKYYENLTPAKIDALLRELE